MGGMGIVKKGIEFIVKDSNRAFRKLRSSIFNLQGITFHLKVNYQKKKKKTLTTIAFKKLIHHHESNFKLSFQRSGSSKGVRNNIDAEDVPGW